MTTNITVHVDIDKLQLKPSTKVHDIQEVRRQTKCGLKVAKEFVDAGAPNGFAAYDTKRDEDVFFKLIDNGLESVLKNMGVNMVCAESGVNYRVPETHLTTAIHFDLNYEDGSILDVTAEENYNIIGDIHQARKIAAVLLHMVEAYQENTGKEVIDD